MKLSKPNIMRIPIKSIALLLILALGKIGYSQAPTVDSARYNDPTQKIVTIYFSEPVLLTDLTGFTINVGAASYDIGNNPFMFIAGLAGNQLDIILYDAFDNNAHITYDDVQIGVTVDYDGSGDLRASDDNTPVAAFSGFAAINNVIIDCTMLEAAQNIGTAASTGPCQDVTVQLGIDWTWTPQARNSIHFNENGIRARVAWRDNADTRINYGMTENVTGSGLFEVITASFTYPTEDVCTFIPTAIPMMFQNTGDLDQPLLVCSGGVNQQDYVLPAYRLDNEELAGELEIDPALGSDPTFYCVGEDIDAFVFSDATTFNCNVIVEPDRPNEGQRWMKFAYGTHATPGIPNTYIDVYGTMVQITDANGDYIPGPFTIDPATGNTVAAYTTRSGFFESELFVVPEPCTAPVATTYPIYHTGNYSTDEEDDVFGVTLLNWGPCNRYHAIAAISADPIESYDELRLVAAPPPPTVPSPDECFSFVNPDISAVGTGGIIDWYDVSDLSNLVYTGDTYTHGESAVGTYTWWLRETRDTGGPNTCISDTVRAVLEIFPLPSDEPVSDDDICELETASVAVSNSESGVAYTLRDNDNDAVVDGPINGTGGDITFNFTPAATDDYNVLARYTSSPFCEIELSDIATVTVNPLADIDDQPNDETICESDNINFEVDDDGDPAVTGYLWQVSTDNGSSWNNATGGIYSDETTNTLELSNVPSSYDGYQYKCILTTAGPCTIESDVATLTVNPQPLSRTVTLDDPYMCYNGSTFFTVENSENGIDYNLMIGAATAATQTGDGSDLTFNVGPLTSTTVYDVIAENSVTSCTRNLGTFTVTINPDLNAWPANANDDICVDTDIDLERINRSGGSGDWDYDWTGTGGFTSSVRNPAPFANAITGAHSYTATLIDAGFLTASTAGGDPTTCTDSYVVNFTVHPLPTDRAVNAQHPQICYNTSTNIRVVNSEAGMSYQLWDNTLTTTFGAPQVGDGSTLSFPTGNLTASTTFAVVATSPTTPACTFELSDHPTVTVNPELTVTADVDDNNICLGTTINLSANPAGGSTSYTYAWSGPDGFVSINQNPSDVPVSEGLPHTYTIVATDDGFTPTAPLAACTATDNVNVTVNLNPTTTVIPAPTGACTNEIVNLDGQAVPGTGTTLTHLWTGDTSPLTATDSETPVFTTPTPGPYALTYRVTDENGCYAEDNTTITVSGPTSDITADAVSAETAGVCDNTNLTLDGNPTPNPTPINGTTHQWSEGPVAAAGALSSTNTQSTVFNSGTVGDYTYYYQVADNSGCLAYDTIIVTVSQVEANPTPVAPEVCAGTPLAIDGVPTGGTGIYTTHTWTEDVGNPEVGTLTNANTQTPTFTASTPGTYTLDYFVQDNAGCNYTYSNYTIIVKPVPDLTNGLNNTICSNNAASVALSITNGPLAVTYSWTAPAYSDASLTGGSAGSGATINDVLRNRFTNTSETATYSVTPTADGCAGPAEDVVVTIDPEPVISAGQTDDECSNVNFDYEILLDNFASGSGVTFTWGAPVTTGGITGGSDRAVASDANITDSFENKTGSDQTATYTVTPYYNGCDGDPVNIVLTIHPQPDITDNQNPETCSDVSTNYQILIANVDPALTSFTWPIPTTTGGMTGGSARPAAVTGNLIDGFTNSSSNTQDATYSVTPYYNGCVGETEDVVVSVKPEPVITPNQSETVCSGVETNLDIQLDNFTNPADDVRFSWNAPTLSIISADFTGGSARLTPSLDPIEDTYTNTTGTQQTATYIVTPVIDGCEGDPVNVIIYINPQPVVAPGQTTTTCSDVAINLEIDVQNLPNGSVDYTWAAPTNTGGMTGGTDRNPASSGSITDVFNNITSGAQTATYNVTPFYNTCSGDPESVVITINPEPVITPGQNPTVCSQDVLNHFIALDNFGAADNVLYEWPAPVLDIDPDFSGGAARLAPNGGNLDDTYTNKSNATLESEYIITPSLNGCEGDPESLIVTVNPEPEITAGQEITVCSGEAINYQVLLENFTNPGDNVTFTWPAPTLDADPDFSGGSARVAGTSNNLADTYTNLSTTQLTATYYITPTYDGCDGEVETVTVRVNPEPQMTSATTETVCSGEVPSLVFSSNIAATYNWEVTFVGGSIIGTSIGETGAGNIPHALVNTGAVSSTVIYRVTPETAAGCEGTPQNISITVNAPAEVTATNDTIFIAAGDATPAGATGLQVTLGGAAVQGAPAQWEVVEPFPAEGSFDDEFSLSPIFTPSANQELAEYTVVRYITNDPDGAIEPCQPDTAYVYINIGQLPEAYAGNDTTICYTPSIELRGRIDGSATVGTWSVIAGGGSGTMSASTTAGNIVTATYTFGADETGVDILTFRLTTNDPDGAGPVAAANDDKDITINPLPLTTAISGPDTVCVSTSNHNFSTTLTPGSYYEWNIPATIGTLDFGGTGTNSNMAIISAAAVGATDSIWLFETNQYGCTRDTVYKPVTVLEQSPSDPITGPDEVCAFSENVTYSVPNFAGSTYQWFFPVGAAPVTDPTLNTVDVNFSQFSGQITVIETNPGGCITNHGPKMITVNSLPVSTINASPTAVCLGDTVTFTAGPVGESNYEFFVNGVSTQNGASNVFKSGDIVNMDQVTVIVTTTDGCSAESLPVMVTVYDLPTVTLASNDSSVCSGIPVNFTASSASAVNYNFYLNGVSQQSGGQNFYTNTTLVDGDEVYVDVLSAFGCAGRSDSITMTVFDLPVASIDGDHTICPGVTENIVVSVTTGISPYDITIDNGVGTISSYLSGDNIPVTPLVSTTYLLTEITDANGCTSTIGPNITGSAVITHLDTVQILTQPKEAAICQGLDTSFTVGAFGSGLSYEWFYSANYAGPYTPVPLSNVSTLPISPAAPAMDGYYYFAEVSSTCNSIQSDTVQLIIKFDPVSARDPFDDAVCEGFPTGFGVDAGITENPVYQWYLSTNSGVSWDALMDTAFYSGTSTDSLIISSTTSRFDGYEYYVQITGECGSSVNSAAATLTVYERPEIIEQPSDTVVCEGNPVQFSIDAGGTSNPVYQWQVDQRDGSNWQNIAIDSLGIYSGHDQATLQVLNPVSRFNQYRYRVVLSGDCNPSQTSSYATLTVNENPEIITPPTDKSLCEEQSTVFSVNPGVTTGPTYTWEVDMNTGSFVEIGADSSVYSGYNTSTLILSTIPATYNGYLYRVTVGGVCPGSITSAAVGLQVDEQPEIIAQPENDTVCENDPAVFIVDEGVTANPGFQWQVNRIGFWANLTAADETSGDYNGVFTNTLTVNNPDLGYNNYRYRVIVSGDCNPSITSDAATLVIDTRPEITQDPVDITICEDDNAQFITNAGGTTDPSYLWEYSSDNGATWNDAALLAEVSQSDLSILNLSGVPSAYDQYRFRATVSGKCTAPVSSAEAILTVWEKPEISIHPADVTSCEQDTVLFTVEAGITTIPVYTWQYNNGATWLAASSGVYEGTNNDTLKINGINTGLNGTRYRVVVSGACNPDSISEEAVLTVDERPEITIQPFDQAICENDGTSFTISTGATTSPTIAWEYYDGSWNTADGGAGIFSDWTTTTLTLSAVPSSWNGVDFRAIVSNGCGPNDTSDVVTLTVYERPEIDIQPSDATTCEGVATLFGIDAGATSSPAYVWEVNDGVSGWQTVSGGQYSGINQDTLNISNPSSYMNGYQYRVVVSGTCPNPVTSDEVTLTVEENPEITTQPVNADICESGNTSFNVDPGVTTNPSFQWYYDDNSGSGMQILNDTPIFGGTTSATLDITGATFAMDEWQFQVEVSGSCGVPVLSDIVELIVYKSPEITVEPQDSTICELKNVAFTLETGDTDSPVILWYENDGSTGWQPISDGGLYIGATTTTLQIFSVDSAMNGYQYHAEVSNLCGGPIVSADVTLTVQNAAEIWQHPVSATVCEGDATNFNVTATGTNLSYQWQVDMRDGNGFQDIAEDSAGIYLGFDQLSLQVLNPTSRFNAYRYRVIVESSACTPPRTSDYAELTVNEVAEIITPPVASTICEEQSTVFTVNAGVTTAPTYLWEVDMNTGTFVTIGMDSAVYSGYNSSVLILSTVPSSYDGYQYRVTVGGVCPSTEQSLPVTLGVEETPEIILQPVNDTVCENDPAQFSVDAGVTSTPAYQWQVNKFGAWANLTAADELSGDYTGVTAQTLDVNNPDISYNNYRYRVIISGTCSPSVTSDAAYLLIDTRPYVAVQPVDRIICEDDNVEFFVSAGTTTNANFLWEYSDNSGTSWNDAATLPEVLVSDNDTLELSAVPSVYDSYWFRATLSGKCPTGSPVYSDTVILTVYDRPEITVQPADVTDCEQDTVMFTVDAGVTTFPSYNWEYYNGATWLSVPSTIYEGATNDTLWVNGISSGINGTRYRVIVRGACSPDSISDEAVLTVDERPEVLGVPLDQTICENDGTSFGISSGVTTSPTISWEYFDGAWNTADATEGIFSDWDTDTIVLSNVDVAWDGTQFRAIVSNGCGPNDTSMVATLTVKYRPDITAEPVDATTCEGIATLFGMDAGITSNPVYTWEVNDGTSGWQPVFGAQYSGLGTDTLHILAPVSSMNGYEYRMILGGYCTPNDTTDEVTLTVTENPEITIQPVDVAICELEDTLFYASPGVTTNPVFQWYVDDNSGGGFVPVINDIVHNGANDSILTITAAPFTMDNYRYQLEVSGDCGVPAYSSIVNLVVYKAPEIVGQPSDTATCELSSVSFTVDVGDTETPLIQWYEDDGSGSGMLPVTDGGSYFGANSSKLLLYGVDSAMTGYEYEARVSNGCGGPIASDRATLTVYSAPQIWQQPDDSTICEGTDAEFSVIATGYDLVYTWFVDDGSGSDTIHNDAVYAGQGTATLSITGADRSYHLYRYYVKIEGGCTPAVQSNIAFLYVNNPPEIQTQPDNDTICEGDAAVFTVAATGYDLNYQWEESTDGVTYTPLSNMVPYSGADRATMQIFNIDRSYDQNKYRVIITGGCGVSTSDEKDLIVKTHPLVIDPPVDLDVCDGEAAEFTVVAEGSDLAYQWQVNRNDGNGYVDIAALDADYTGQQSDTLTKLIADAATEDGYTFRVIVDGYCSTAAPTTPVILSISELPTISVDPTPSQVCEGAPTLFTATATGPNLSYLWEVSSDNGATWTGLTNNGIYSGVETNQLSILNTIFASMHENQYRLSVWSPCDTVYSAGAELTVWENPTTTIIGDQASFPVICGGDILTLDGDPQGGSGTYDTHTWSGEVTFLNDLTSQTTQFESMVKGTYDITYRVVDNNGCYGMSTVTIDNHMPTAKFGPDVIEPSCGLNIIDFENRSSAEATIFNWDFGYEGNTSALENPTQGFENFTGIVQSYPVVLQAGEDVFGDGSLVCTATSPTKYVTIYPKVKPEITADTTIGCHPLTVLLESTAGAGIYNWDFGDGSYENAGYNFSNHTFTNYTTGDVTYEVVLQTISDLGGCEAYDTIEITVHPKPSPMISASPNPSVFPDEGNALISFANGTDDGPWTYEYDFGDGSERYTTSSNANVTHEYAEPGSYTVKLYAYIGDCMDSAVTIVTITPQPPVANFIADRYEACTPAEIQFTNLSRHATEYYWEFGDGGRSNNKDTVHVYYTEGEYPVKLTAIGPGGTSTVTQNVVIHQTPDVFFTYTYPYPDDSIYVKQDMVVFYNHSQFADYFLWNFGDVDEFTGQVAEGNTSTDRQPSYIYQYEGLKTTKLVASNDYCSDSLTIPHTHLVVPAGEIRFPNVFRPLGQGGEIDWTDPESYNNIFFPGISRQVLRYDLYVYTRWGEQIFHSDDVNVGWDGYLPNNDKAPQGVYIWKVEGVYSNGAPFSDAGDVTLLWRQEGIE